MQKQTYCAGNLNFQFVYTQIKKCFWQTWVTLNLKLQVVFSFYINVFRKTYTAEYLIQIFKSRGYSRIEILRKLIQESHDRSNHQLIALVIRNINTHFK